ncbi:MAG: HepT-like ribonuclease domain-containing protein [Tepidisphaeraceae bacterium]|jgi:uncharacterized protein with HEPN domain
MSRVDDTLYLGHMLDVARWTRNRVAGLTREQYDSDETLRLALTRQIQIIGEAAWRVSPAGRAKLPDVPWNKIATMRHKLVHDYFDVNFGIIWETATTDMQPLIDSLLKVIPPDPEP